MKNLLATGLFLVALTASGKMTTATTGGVLKGGGSCAIPNSQKLNCGHVGTTQQECLNHGCCWQPEGSGSKTPWCYFNHAAQPCAANFTTTGGSSRAPFSDEAVSLMTQFFLNNLDIQGDGGVVASPDTDLKPQGGSYYYHWMRDGALSMRTLMTVTEAGFSGANSTMNSEATIHHYMGHYTNWVLKHQSMSDPNGIDIRVEPKFYLPDGGPYTGGWCRPQSDGPGLRTLALVKYANWLIQRGNMSFVTSNLYGSSAPNGGAIYYDMQFLVNNWQMNSCDLWEEVRSTDFFWNRFNFRRAFLEAAALATALGHSSDASSYTQAAQDVENTLQAHWNGQYVYEETNRKQDGAVIAAFNNGYVGDSVFPPHGYQVAGTIATYNNVFCQQYPINNQDTSNGIPGILYGRYPGDVYAGGNPWVLTTGALAQLFYRAAIATANNTAGVSVSYSAWAAALNMPASSWSSDMDLARSMAMAGDAVLERIHYHVKGAGYHLSEQLDKYSGVELSATDLTWSYATVLKAMVSRAEALKLLNKW